MIPVESLQEILNQAQVLHWQTHSFARHQALGGFYEGMSDLLDSYVESAMGNIGRPTVGDTIMVKNIDEYDPVVFIEDVIVFLKELKDEVPTDFSDLQNILDEMVALANKTKYLFSLS